MLTDLNKIIEFKLDYLTIGSQITIYMSKSHNDSFTNALILFILSTETDEKKKNYGQILFILNVKKKQQIKFVVLFSR